MRADVTIFFILKTSSSHPIISLGLVDVIYFGRRILSGAQSGSRLWMDKRIVCFFRDGSGISAFVNVMWIPLFWPWPISVSLHAADVLQSGLSVEVVEPAVASLTPEIPVLLNRKHVLGSKFGRHSLCIRPKIRNRCKEVIDTCLGLFLGF